MSKRYYAGIGSRYITDSEKALITKISQTLSKKGFVCYSGNADGADITFQRSSEGQCVVFMPWKSFNIDKYLMKDALDHVILGNDPDYMKISKNFHHNKKMFNKYNPVGMLHTRNAGQVLGYSPKNLPKVEFVLFCADEDEEGNVKGGTGQAIRIANYYDVPTFNLRMWKRDKQLFLNFLNKK